MMPPADLADIDATITYWRTRGTYPGSIARDLRSIGLRCPHDTWASVRAAMIALETIRQMPLRRAA